MHLFDAGHYILEVALAVPWSDSDVCCPYEDVCRKRAALGTIPHRLAVGCCKRRPPGVRSDLIFDVWNRRQHQGAGGRRRWEVLGPQSFYELISLLAALQDEGHHQPNLPLPI